MITRKHAIDVQHRLKVDLKKSWEALAPLYQRSVKISTNDIHYGPNSDGENRLRLLGTLKDKKLLDLGCGGGQTSIAFAKRGAKVTAIDFSKEQIQYAKEQALKEGAKINFIVADIKSVKRMKQQFDIIFSSFSFQYIDDLVSLFKYLSKLLKRNGVLLFALHHPVHAMKVIRKYGNGYLVLFNDYFTKKKIFWYWKIDSKKYKFASFYHNINEVSNALYKSGFLIERLIEQQMLKNPKQSPYYDETYTYDDTWRKVPYTLIYKAIKRR